MDVFRVGVSIMMGGNASQMLSRISHQLLGVHVGARLINNQFGRWGPAIAGAGSILAGGLLLRGMVKLVEHAREYSHEMAQLKIAGFTPTELVSAERAAWETTLKTPGARIEKVVSQIGQLRAIFGDAADAIASL